MTSKTPQERAKQYADWHWPQDGKNFDLLRHNFSYNDWLAGHASRDEEVRELVNGLKEMVGLYDNGQLAELLDTDSTHVFSEVKIILQKQRILLSKYLNPKP